MFRVLIRNCSIHPPVANVDSSKKKEATKGRPTTWVLRSHLIKSVLKGLGFSRAAQGPKNAGFSP
jgi:hypothetical protein